MTSVFRIRLDKPPQFVLPLWPSIDYLLCQYHHVRHLDGGSGIMVIEIKRYKKNTFTLSDGSVIRPGDTILELHLNNNWFKKKRKLNLTTPQLNRQILASFARDLSVLSVKIGDGTLDDVVALHGCTHLGRGARRLGFQVEALPDTTWKKWARFYLAGLVRVYGARRKEFSALDELPELEEVWLSIPELLKRYSPGQA
jgi:hypothetical protein